MLAVKRHPHPDRIFCNAEKKYFLSGLLKIEA